MNARFFSSIVELGQIEIMHIPPSISRSWESMLLFPSFIVIYSLLTGAMILGWWGLRLAKKVPELQKAPKEVMFHLVAEVLTASFLIVSGIGLLLGFPWARILSPVSLGMLLYAVINIAGPYAQQENRRMLIILVAVVILTVSAIFSIT